MIRRVRLFAGADGQSQVEECTLSLASVDARNALSDKTQEATIYFEERAAGSRRD